MEIGQAVKARFLTLPSPYMDDKKNTRKDFPIRAGVVTFVHPKNRFVCVTTRAGGLDVTEAFSPLEVIV